MGRYRKDGAIAAHPPSSIPFLALGAWILTVGWFGFNVMSAQSVEGVSGLVAVNSLMAMVGGMTRVDRDVPPFCLVEGHPGRVRGLNRVGLRRSGLGEQHEGRELRQLQEIWSLLYRSEHVIAEGLKLARAQELLPAADHLCTFLEGSVSKGRRGPMPAASR